MLPNSLADVVCYEHLPTYDTYPCQWTPAVKMAINVATGRHEALEQPAWNRCSGTDAAGAAARRVVAAASASKPTASTICCDRPDAAICVDLPRFLCVLKWVAAEQRRLRLLMAEIHQIACRGTGQFLT